ncbi:MULTISPECIES: winged helix-turn-helix domain-containing protein [unclassified Pseudofrankia]|uniref:winged helix-turn-helix domain-containing protein n=1 Tax=unclassified Pseudofrankia TaxID=2994372 RepID=UPI0008D9816D|nr:MULTISPECIES: winged helix-turn-helix domain-containing protein [unclassified Pseudofrankia]MDT3447005.1 winged helix-turn-helix domain-containing protein [Pseudofrankia sp. BMG5.37]OHV54570.1 transposase [Pseudofrankia sp. BMG5.36]
MRYATGGGLTPAEQIRRERVRLAAVDWFARGVSQAEVAREFHVTPKTVSRWHRAWEDGGVGALRSRGPLSACRLDDRQLARLEALLRRGPGTCGWDDQRWTLARIRRVIAVEFGVDYTEAGVWYLLERQGWSCQLPARQASERDDEAIEAWRKEPWSAVKPRRRPVGPGSVSSTRPARA